MIPRQLIAHRGGLEHAPENTLEAFASAIAMGADGIELDLQMLDDGALLVRHDMIAAEAGEADLPRLDQVLDMVAERRPDMRIVVDVKATPWTPGLENHGLALIERAAPQLRAYVRPDRIVLGSFDWIALEHARDVLPEFPTAFHTMAARWLAGLPLQQTGVADVRDYLAYMEAWRQARGPGMEALSALDAIKGAGGKIWSCLHRDLTPQAVAHARALGLEVWTWTVNTEDDLNRVLAMGVDAVTTDRPQHLIELLKSPNVGDRS